MATDLTNPQIETPRITALRAMLAALQYPTVRIVTDAAGVERVTARQHEAWIPISSLEEVNHAGRYAAVIDDRDNARFVYSATLDDFSRQVGEYLNRNQTTAFTAYKVTVAMDLDTGETYIAALQMVLTATTAMTPPSR